MKTWLATKGGHQIAFNPLAQANRQLSKLLPPTADESARQTFGGQTRRTIENYDLRVRGSTGQPARR